MSNSELGMLLMVIVCLVFTVITVITVITAGRRIEEEKKKYENQRQHNKMLADCINRAAQTDKEEQKKVEAEIDRHKMRAAYAELNSIQNADITAIATELCKRSDVVHFLIDVKNDTQKYSLSGGH